jgi:murein DD-endopeptidase MepM/ murein hydrolase activator NlpD
MADKKNPNNYNKSGSSNPDAKRSADEARSNTGSVSTKRGDQIAQTQTQSPEYNTPGNSNESRSPNLSTAPGRLISEDDLAKSHSFTDATPLDTYENTPTAQGYPYQDRVAAQKRAAEIIGSDNPPEAVESATDPGLNAAVIQDAVTTQNSLDTESDYVKTVLADSRAAVNRYANQAQVSTPEYLVDTLGPAPHYFREQDYQVFYHDARVWIQGADVSSWLEGSISIRYNLGKDPNSCDLTLNNAAHRFTLTPENLSGVWRLAEHAFPNDYDETAKYKIFKLKSEPTLNHPDPISGGLVWSLAHWRPIFHKMDPIRVWIRNPAAHEINGDLADEWIPAFTGYITSFPKSENFINASSTLQIHAEDFRYVINKMRVNSSTTIYTTKEGGEVVDPTSSEAIDGARLQFNKNVNVQFDRTFFKDLIVSSENTDPWVDLTMPEVVEALTFNEDAQVMINSAKNRRALELEKKIKEYTTRLNFERDKDERARLLATLNTLKYEKQQNYPSVGDPLPDNKRDQPANSRMGRMQRGFFRGANAKVAYPDAGDREGQIQFMQNWYSLCMFGSKVRGTDGYLQYDLGKLGYWTLKDIEAVGKETASTHPWAPDAQAVHMIEPGTATTALPIFQDVAILQGANTVSGVRGYTTRMEILAKACDIADYRFWVTGTGDLVFEFPQYDFKPDDYGTWAEVLNFDHQVLDERLDEENGEVPNVLVAAGSITGRTDVPTDTQTFAAHLDHVIVWCPALAARLGINKTELTLNRVTVKERLIQLAYMELQKKMAILTHYSMTTCYRPWVLPNKPVFNKYRTRYALVENVTNTVPATSGSIAGHTAPSTSLSLNYVRTLDVYGVPRYITGGPSMPIFYGERRSNALIASLNQSVETIKSFFDQLGSRDTSLLTPSALRELREQYGAFLPVGQDIHNVVAAEVTKNAAAAQGPNAIEVLNSAAVAATTALSQLQDTVDRGLSPAQQTSAIQAAKDAIDRLSDLFKKLNVDYKPQDSAYGLLPAAGVSGFRHDDYEPPSDRPQQSPQQPQKDNTCDLDRYTFSSPLGRIKSDLTYNNQIIQQAGMGDFPRVAITQYEQPPRVFAPGVPAFSGIDFLGKSGENVYAVANGTVQDIEVNTKQYGTTIRIAHDNGYLTAYGPVNPSVSKGDSVIRNQVIGTLASSARSQKLGAPVLHFQTATGQGSSVGDVVGYMQGQYRTYTLTKEDLDWAVRAVIGEESDPSRKDHSRQLLGMSAVISSMITRFVYKNDESLAEGRGMLWPTFTTMLVGKPPFGRGYSQPVSYYWRTAEPPADGKKPVIGNRSPEAIARRERVRNLGTPDGNAFPQEVYQMVLDLMTGRKPLNNGEGAIDFRANDAQVPVFLQNNAKLGCRIDNEVIGAGNVFFSMEGSRKMKAAGFPKIQPFPPADLKLTFYDPTNSGTGMNPGVPNKVYTVNDTTKYSRDAWKDNTILVVGSLASSSFGTELKSQLEARGASVQLYGQPGGIPGGFSSRALTSPENLKAFKDKLSSVKPDVTFVVYGASNQSAQELSQAMSDIHEAVIGEGSDLWWVGPPTYSDRLSDLATYRDIFEQAGPALLGDRYVSSSSFTSPVQDRTPEGLVTPVGARKWVSGIVQSTHGVNKGDPNGKPTSQVSGGDWPGAIPPEECPPTKQSKTNS